MLGINDRSSDGDTFFGVFEKSALKSVELPETLRRIAPSAFANCESLENARLPEGLEFIGEKAFFNTKFADIKVRK